MSTDLIHPVKVDDFQVIRGIGAGIERRLHQAGIHTYADLAASSPEELAAILKGLPGFSQASTSYKNWISKGSELAKAQMVESHTEPRKARPLSIEERATGESQVRYENYSIVLRMGEDNQVNRTRIMHIQDSSEHAWAGWDSQKLLDFIAAHSGLQDVEDAQSKNETYPDMLAIPDSGKPGIQMPEMTNLSQPGEQRMAALAGGDLAITKMEVKSVEQPNSSRILRQGEAFHVCLGLNMGQIDRPAGTVFNYSAAVFAQELNTRTRQKVASGQGKLTLANQADIEFKGDPLPSGVYRFEAMVMLTEEGSPDPQARRTAFLDGGLFQVD